MHYAALGGPLTKRNKSLRHFNGQFRNRDILLKMQYQSLYEKEFIAR